MRSYKLSVTALVALLVLMPVFLCAQVDTVWVHRWTSPGAESDWAYAIAVDDSGYAYVTGKAEVNGGDCAVIKYYPDGDTAWMRIYPGTGTATERASSIAIGPTGNVYLTGYTMSSGAGDYLTIKYRPNGDLSWTQIYNGISSQYDFANWVAVDDEENVYVTGYSRGLSYQYDIATVKYDSSGNQLWVARFDGSGNWNDEGQKVIAGNDGYVYVTGDANQFSSGNIYNYVTIKYYAIDGDTAWVRTYNGPADSSSDQARDLEVDASGNVYVTGSSRGVGTLNDILTIKYDSLGDEKWIARYDNPDTSLTDGGYGIEVDSAGNVYVTGQSQGIGTSTDFVTIKYDSLGNQLWATRYNGPANGLDRPSDETGGKCMAIDQYANIYVGGISRGATSLNDYIAIMYDSAGVEQWVVGYNFCDSTDNALALAIDNSGGVYITGRSVGLGTYGDWATVKYWSAVGVEEGESVATNRLLLEVHPNPARTYSTISYSLRNEGAVSLSIYDVSGRLVRNLIGGYQKPDVYSIVWNGRDCNNRSVAPGVYFCMLNVDGDHVSRKIVMME
jgi:hypothetical protein